MNTREQVWPQVVMDISIGKHTDDFEVDMDAITAHLREHDVPDSSIADLKVSFIDEQPKRSPHLDGRYKPFRNSIEVYVGRYFKIHDVLQDKLPASKHDGLNELASSRVLTSEFNETLYHELEHAIVKSEGGMPEAKTHIRKSVMKSALRWVGVYGVAMGAVEVSSNFVDPTIMPVIGGVAIGGAIWSARHTDKKDMRKLYQNNPEEIRCFNAQKSEGLVGLSYKSPERERSM